MNQITTKQNETIAIKRLGAQRALYSRAKTLFALQLILNVPVLILLAGVALALDKEWWGLPKIDIAWVIGLAGALCLLLDALVWNTMISRYREHAARIQQTFDSAVLDIPFNEILYGKTADKEVVEEWSEKYNNTGRNDLINWYRVEVAALPMDAARLVCQRSNCWWDMAVRRRYNLVVVILCALFMLAMIGIAIGLDCTAKTVFGLIVAPILPFLTVAIKLIQDNVDAINRLQTMKDEIEAMWDRVLNKTVSDAELKEFSQSVQAGIHMNRRSNPLIFDWIHNRLRPKNEATTSKTTAEFVAEYSRSRNPLGIF